MSLNTMVDETIEKRLQGLFGPTLDKTPPAYLKRNVMDAIGKIADKRFAGHSRRVVMKGNFFAMAADDGESIALEMDDQASQVTLRLWSMRGSAGKYLLELSASQGQPQALAPYENHMVIMRLDGQEVGRGLVQQGRMELDLCLGKVQLAGAWSYEMIEAN